MVKTRFAPSPTGLLHIGNLRIALISWFYARSQNGKFILRIDNTDRERSQEHYIKKIQEDLSWLGINWDESFQQLTRMQNYQAAKKKLINTGRLYPCFETEGELEIKKKELIKRGMPPIYDRAALKLSDTERKKLMDSGKNPHWRFFLKDGLISWNDKVRGTIKFEAKKLSDPVLIREDSSLTYSLASVVDDIDYEITDIIRGEDHISNSAIHLQIFEALEAKTPNLAHISLTKAKDAKLSKRFSGGSIHDLRKKHILPQTIINYLAKMGTSNPLRNLQNSHELIKAFSLQKLSKSTIIYDEKDLHSLNEKAIHTASFRQIKPIIDSLQNNNISEKFWLDIRDNLQNLNEIFEWWEICTKTINTKITNRELAKIALQSMPDDFHIPNAWENWIKNIKSKTSLRGKALFVPLRLTITGRSKGPEMHKILPHISRNLIFNRFSQ